MKLKAAGTSPARRARRDWHANLLATPQFTFHLKESLQADLAARAIRCATKPSAAAS